MKLLWLALLAALVSSASVSFPDYPGNTICYSELGNSFRYYIAESINACLNVPQNSYSEILFTLSQSPSVYTWKVSQNFSIPGNYTDAPTQYFSGSTYVNGFITHRPFDILYNQPPATYTTNSSANLGSNYYQWCHDGICEYVDGSSIHPTYTWNVEEVNATLLDSDPASITCSGGGTCPQFTFRSNAPATLSMSPPANGESYSIEETISFAVAASSCCSGNYRLDFYKDTMLLGSSQNNSINANQGPGVFNLRLIDVLNDPAILPNKAVAYRLGMSSCSSPNVSMSVSSFNTHVNANCPQGIVVSKNATVSVFALNSGTPTCDSTLAASQDGSPIISTDLGCDSGTGKHDFLVSGYSSGSILATASSNQASASCQFESASTPSEKRDSVKAPELELVVVLLIAFAAAFASRKNGYNQKRGL